mmetsp:Transcript_23643/g.82286  ORF Transcript_23643/g.82286 Transcript_23643/m.82286 type:complete len:210 (-) Transcript_23643:234-863(-)
MRRVRRRRLLEAREGADGGAAVGRRGSELGVGEAAAIHARGGLQRHAEQGEERGEHEGVVEARLVLADGVELLQLLARAGREARVGRVEHRFGAAYGVAVAVDHGQREAERHDQRHHAEAHAARVAHPEPLQEVLGAVARAIVAAGRDREHQQLRDDVEGAAAREAHEGADERQRAHHHRDAQHAAHEQARGGVVHDHPHHDVCGSTTL